MSDNRVEIKVNASVDGAPDIDKLSGSLSGIDPAARTAEAGTRKAADGFDAMGTAALKINNIKQLIGDMVSVLGGVPADVLKTADAYNNLAARVQLVTGTGPAFEAAFTGIAEVAQRTSSNLESTGLLFTKLAEAGKSMGIGQAEALKLTETVNQAIQLSGASAGASDAAIIQLVQGLQGGVLRGDEFNSVMEQSPRLAKALADGLGVTTGELRKMAEAGQLSSDVVIKSLQGQSAAVATEFAKLPPTVGRALENLSTSWTLYVGETDKATGASKAAATVISALAGNLSTLAGYLIDVGQAAAAFAALKLAQHFIGIATAATSSAAAVVANATAINAAGAASTAATANVGKFASILSSLKTFSLIGIVTNFSDIGTAIGEAAAKLMGYKDRTNELAAADKTAATIAADNAAQRQRMAEATQAAIDKQFELGKSATTAIAEFDKLTKAGDTTSEAIKKIGKDFDLASVPGIRNATAVLDKLVADGKISATEFQAAWADALKGVDLAQFEVKARAAFAGTARETERLAQVLDATLRESIKRTGLDFDLISGGMSKASISAINDTDAMIKGLDRLKAMGVDTAQALTASLGKGINTADSQKAIEAVRLQIEEVRKVLGDKVADGLLDQAKTKATELGDALDKSTPGITSLREAMKELGVTSDQTFKDTAAKSAAAYGAMKDSGTASIRELQDGFKKYAESALAASGAVGSSQRAITEAALKTEGAIRGLSVEFDKNGKMAIDSQAKAQDAFHGTRDAVDAVTTALERQNAEIERGIAAEEKAQDLKDRKLALDQKAGRTLVGVNFDQVPTFKTEVEAQAWLKADQEMMQRNGPSSGSGISNAVLNMKRNEYDLQLQFAKDAEKTEFANQAASAGYSSSQSLGLADEYLNRRKSGSASGSFSDFLSQTRAGDKAAPAPTPAQTTPSPDAKTPTSASTQNHTYTVNIPNYGTVNVASASDASSLTNIIDQLARAKAAAGV
ncbi:MAG: tape measure protein [Comamonadaceae bacterium]|nr:tape measure protein [Comamonadaceae bacterium]